jgi:hypothetical protein
MTDKSFEGSKRRVVLKIVKVASTELVATVVLTNHHIVYTGLEGFVSPQKDDRAQV